MLQTRYYKIILIFLLVHVLAKGQNMVLNGNFEIYSNCPTTTNQFKFVTSWINGDTTDGSPDYFNSCTNSNVNVPHTVFGYQKDCCGGSGIVGIYTFNKFFPNDGREYIQTKLIDTLEANHKYIVSMYVNRCNDFDYAMASIGMYFTSTAIQGPSNVAFINVPNPQIKNSIVLNDTMNWTLIKDTLTAAGTEMYLTIGNFSTDSLSDTLQVIGNGTYSGGAYYYIDGVSVYDLATMGIEQIAVSNEQLNIYPNPSNGNMAVEYKITNDAELQIIDLNGNLVEVYNLPATGNRIEVKNQNLQNGVYLYRISSNNAVIKFGKVVIMK